MEVKSKQSALMTGLAEILEVGRITPETVLDASSNWDSMAVVMTVALIDDVCGLAVDGPALSKCLTVADVLALAGPDL